MLEAYGNYAVDLSGRIAELGRKPRATRSFVLAHVDRVLWGSDIYPPRANAYAIQFRFLETADEDFAYSTNVTPPQGRWNVAGLELPPDALAAVYRDNALRLLTRLRT
jgi:predicted TIM-barrel fold metal-dependent hydrolase